MILPYELKELGFELDEKYDDIETYTYTFDNCNLLIEFKDYQKTVKIYIFECGWTGSMELKGEVTINRIKNLIKALS